MGGIQAIHYADFSGDLRETACGRSLAVELDGLRVTVFMSSATCSSCQAAIQRRLGALLDQGAITVTAAATAGAPGAAARASA